MLGKTNCSPRTGTGQMTPGEGENKAILAAESDPVDAARLFRALALLGYRVTLATSPEQVLEMIRQHVFPQAVVAAEMTLGDEPILARLARLPSMRCLVATGPAGQTEMEQRGRLSGATVYLPRPVTIEALAKALRVPVTREFT